MLHYIYTHTHTHFIYMISNQLSLYKNITTMWFRNLTPGYVHINETKTLIWKDIYTVKILIWSQEGKKGRGARKATDFMENLDEIKIKFWLWLVFNVAWTTWAISLSRNLVRFSCCWTYFSHRMIIKTQK